MLLFFFFFFKQKTAYEMRISDWSSDVCSSDLAPCQARAVRIDACARGRQSLVADTCARGGRRRRCRKRRFRPRYSARGHAQEPDHRSIGRARHTRAGCLVSSEDPTSELQSLMRISYAYFCLQHNNNKRTSHHLTTNHYSA